MFPKISLEVVLVGRGDLNQARQALPLLGLRLVRAVRVTWGVTSAPRYPSLGSTYRHLARTIGFVLSLLSRGAKAQLRT